MTILSLEDLLRALAVLYRQANPQQRAAIRLVVARLVNPPPIPDDLREALKQPQLAVDPKLILPFVTDDDWRSQVRNAKPEWLRVMTAQVLRSQHGLKQRDLASIFAALADTGKLAEDIHRQVRIDQNPGGTGKNAEYEHEIAESDLLLPEDDPSPLELAPSSDPDPAEVVADADAVNRALARFGKRTADLLRLMMEGKSASEAAEELGISPSTARTLLERARKQFSRNP